MSTATDLVLPASEIDETWMTARLRASGWLDTGCHVTDVAYERCGTGLLADSFRFTLDYDTPGAGPATVVGKFPSADESSRAFGRQSGYYATEIRFYEQIAPTLDALRLPDVAHAALAENETDFVLLMEDLSPARVVDQLVGCTPDESALVMEQAAALHAASWGDRALADTGWLGGIVASFTTINSTFASTIAAFPEAFGDLVPQMHVAEAAKVLDVSDEWQRVMDIKRCLWHSDLRADNLLFDAKDGTVPVAVLDWQGVGYGCGTIDVAYHLSTSLSTEDRRAHERDLVELYHQKLVASGVSGYSAEECWDDYRVMAINPLQMGTFAIGAVKRSERSDRMFQTWLERSATHTADLDSYGALRARR